MAGATQLVRVAAQDPHVVVPPLGAPPHLRGIDTRHSPLPVVDSATIIQEIKCKILQSIK